MRCYKLVIPRSRATARPYGSEPYSRIGAKNKHFLFQSQFDFLHARVRVAPPLNNSASPQHPNQLATPLNYRCSTLASPKQLRKPVSLQRISQARRNESHRPAAPPLPARARVGTN